MNGAGHDVLRYYVLERHRRATAHAICVDGMPRPPPHDGESDLWVQTCLAVRGVPELALDLLTLLWLATKETPRANELYDAAPVEGLTVEWPSSYQPWTGDESQAVPTGIARSMNLHEAARALGISARQARRLERDAVLTVVGNLAEMGAR